MSQHATAATRGRMQTVPTSACACVFSPSRLASWTLPHQSFPGAKDCSRDILIGGDKALLLDGFVAKGKIEGVDPQCALSLSASVIPTPSQPITRRRAGHYPRRRSRTRDWKPHDWSIQAKSETLVLSHQTAAVRLATHQKAALSKCESDLLSHTERN